ncbi:MAG: hypothetical protein KC900_13225 [Candidatus Omnitrophica bacterium]|nr:hypothetical protein [Candidatus Omnitrophota bacterium]
MSAWEREKFGLSELELALRRRDEAELARRAMPRDLYRHRDLAYRR